MAADPCLNEVITVGYAAIAVAQAKIALGVAEGVFDTAFIEWDECQESSSSSSSSQSSLSSNSSTGT